MTRHSNRRPALAIFDGRPAFSEPLHVGRPNLPDPSAILERIGGCLNRCWLTNGGPLVREFEQRVAAEAGVRHCVATANGTIALELAARALDLRGEVIVPSFTFVATAHALSWHGIVPVFCDVDRATHNIDPADVLRRITPRTSAILCVHLWGRGCETGALSEIADRHGIRLLFDAAHAFGCTCGGRPIGTFGDCEVFSFHATKFVHCGEGGAVVTNDGNLADRLRLLRNFGFAGIDRIESLGVNGKMSELAAAVGLTSLDHQGAIVATNRANHEAYRRRLQPLTGLKVLGFDPSERHNFQYVVVEVDEREAGLTRDELVAVLFAENVLARRYFFPGCHRMEPYRAASGETPQPLPATEDLAARVLVLPTGMRIDDSIVAQIADILARAIEGAPAVRRHLARRRAA